MSGMADERVVFKQSYKPRNAPSTRVLNLKHLEYITTRPGVMCNSSCGFGCFGKIADMTAMAMSDIYEIELQRHLWKCELEYRIKHYQGAVIIL